MTRKRWLYLLIPFILGCNYLFPPPEGLPAAPATQGGGFTRPATEPALPTQGGDLPATPAESQPKEESAFTLMRIHKTDGNLYAQLALHAQQAQVLHQTPFLEFDATWCPPCIAINESLDAQDQITLDAFAGTYIIRADVDEWGWGDGEQFDFEGIPIYFRLSYDGTPTGAMVDGNAWGENIPKNFAPVLDAFFHAP